MTEATRTNLWKIGFIILAIAVVLWVGYALTVPRAGAELGEEQSV